MKQEFENKADKKLGQGLFELFSAIAELWSKKEHEAKCVCCEIPETACPPRCAGRIEWKFARGAAPEATIEVRNTGTSARDFEFSATPLVGVEPGNASLQVLPASATLQPNQTVAVHVKLVSSTSMRPCQSYRAEVSIRGGWERCVEFDLEVVRDPFDSAEIEQSDSLADKALRAPVTKQTLHWEIDRGVAPSAKISVRNASRSTTTFNVEVTPLIGVDSPIARLTATPSSLRLGADQCSVVRLELVDSLSLSPGQTYTCDVTISGFYAQRLAIVTSVLPEAARPLQVEVGDPPTHIRAHHWYDHFQCTDPCVTSRA